MGSIVSTTIYSNTKRKSPHPKKIKAKITGKVDENVIMLFFSLTSRLAAPVAFFPGSDELVLTGSGKMEKTIQTTKIVAIAPKTSVPVRA